MEETPIEPELASVPDKCNIALVSALEDPGHVTRGKSCNRGGDAFR